MVTDLKKQGITLAELLIVITLLSIVIFGVYGTNFMGQLRKANDLKRKEALSKIQKVLEDFHTDHDRYPTVNELAYEPTTDAPALAGKVCGSRKTEAIVQNYIGELPCDPKSPSSDYVYFVFDNNQKFAIFTRLEIEDDPRIEELNCQDGCSYFTVLSDPDGSISNNYFNYYTASSDFNIEKCWGRTEALIGCYPYREPGQRCQTYVEGESRTDYRTLYCKTSWCVTECPD